MTDTKNMTTKEQREQAQRNKEIDLGVEISTLAYVAKASGYRSDDNLEQLAAWIERKVDNAPESFPQVCRILEKAEATKVARKVAGRMEI